MNETRKEANMTSFSHSPRDRICSGQQRRQDGAEQIKESRHDAICLLEPYP